MINFIPSCLSSIRRLLLYNFLHISLFVVITSSVVSATPTTTLEVGYFDAVFNYLPINGSFVFRPSSSNLIDSNSSLLNVMVENRSIAVCNLDLFNSSGNTNKSSWKIFKWSLSSDGLHCSVIREDESIISKTNRKLLQHLIVNDSISIRFGSEKVVGCLTNLTINDMELASFNCTRSTNSPNTRGDVLSPFHNGLMSIQHFYHVKCSCDDFPTPGPFLSSNLKDFSPSGVENSTANASMNFSNRTEANSTIFNVSSSNFANESEFNSNIDNGTTIAHMNADNFTTLAPKLRTNCDSQPCLNNGTCRESNGTDVFSGLAYHCECSEEFFGINCQSFNACHDATQSQRCQNNGTCISALNETTKCLCVSNFTGLFCEIDMNASSSQTKLPNVIDADPCATTPCLNNGTCIKVSSTNFTCKCSPVWDGDRICSKKHSDIAVSNCSTTKCNGGVCKPDGNCDCTNTGFTGISCEQDVNECTLLNPCKNEAVCNNTNGSYECVCVSGFSGKNCTEAAGSAQKSGGESSSNVGAIVGGIFGALAFIGLIIGGVFLFRYLSRSRKLKGKYNPAKEELNNAGGTPMPLSTLPTGERLI